MKALIILVALAFTSCKDRDDVSKTSFESNDKDGTRSILIFPFYRGEVEGYETKPASIDNIEGTWIQVKSFLARGDNAERSKTESKLLLDFSKKVVQGRTKLNLDVRYTSEKIGQAYKNVEILYPKDWNPKFILKNGGTNFTAEFWSEVDNEMKRISLSHNGAILSRFGLMDCRVIGSIFLMCRESAGDDLIGDDYILFRNDALLDKLVSAGNDALEAARDLQFQ